MLRTTFSFLLAFSLTTLFSGAYASKAEPNDKELRFGSVAMNIPAEMHRRLKPLTQYLSKELDRPVSLRLSPNMPAAIDSVASNEVELAYLTPVAYIRSNEKGNTQIVAKTVTKDKASFQLMIAVKEDSPIKTVNDLAGKRFAFGDKAALLQRAAVVGAGMPLEKLGEYQFIGHYDNIVRGVMNGDFDAGILKDTMAFKWEGKGIRILYATPHLPPYNIAASSKVDDATMKAITDAFLKLDINNADHKRVIHALDKKYTGFAATSDSEYDVVRELVAPFN